MDSKPLLQERPPAYASVQGGYDYGQQHNYGAIPPPAPAPPPPVFHEPPPPPPYYTGGQGMFSCCYSAHLKLDITGRLPIIRRLLYNRAQPVKLAKLRWAVNVNIKKKNMLRVTVSQ